jgi:hypothetical protein
VGTQAMSVDKQLARDLIDQLGPRQLAAVIHLLRIMVTPEDDEATLSPTGRQAIAEADEWLKTNTAIPNEEILAEFGLTTLDWERMGQGPSSENTSGRNG